MVVVSLLAVVLVLYWKYKNNNNQQSTSNEMSNISSSHFKDIQEKTTNKELESEINMLPLFSTISQLGIICNVEEISFSQTLLVFILF